MNMDRNRLKEILTEVKDNDYKVPAGIGSYELTLEMLEYLGDTDPQLRDELIYSVFFRLADAGSYSKEQLKQIVSIALDDKHLFYRIGEQESTSVFMRAFSVLVIAVCIYIHRKEPFLDSKGLLEVKAQLLEYTLRELDVRGYVKEGGWAHTAAHTADALDELAQCGELGSTDLLEILEAVKDKVCINHHAYICYEDERLAIAANSVINREVLSEAEIVEWIRSFKAVEGEKVYPQRYYLLSNKRNFLNSLFYRLPEGKYDIIKSAISETVLAIRAF